MNRIYPFLLAVLLALVLPGCSSGSVAPRFQVVSARAAQRTDEGVRLEITVVGENPNDHEIALGEARYTITADGSSIYSGTASPEVTLPRYGRVEMIFPAAVPLSVFPSNAGAIGLSGWIEYLPPGPFAELLYDAGLRRPTSGVEGSTSLTP
ncbi:MAG: LEA type 2 family protein [Phycisphaerales bacterium]|nr:LEA type 2 family protein [Phycisphaerales bacterium]